MNFIKFSVHCTYRLSKKKKKFGRKIMQVCQLGMTEAKTE